MFFREIFSVNKEYYQRNLNLWSFSNLKTEISASNPSAKSNHRSQCVFIQELDYSRRNIVDLDYSHRNIVDLDYSRRNIVDLTHKKPYLVIFSLQCLASMSFCCF